MDLSAHLVTNTSDFEILRDKWQDLLAHSAANEPVLSPDWLLTWWEVFGPAQRRRLVTLKFEHRGELVGLAPLSSRQHLHRRVVPVRRLDFVGGGEDPEHECCSCYLGLIARRGLEREVVESFADAVTSPWFPAWDELQIPEMSGDSNIAEMLCQAFARRGLFSRLTTSDEALYIPLPSSWDAYLQSLSRKRRYFVRRSLRDFERWAGTTAAIECATTPADLPRGMQILEDLHAERWRDSDHGGAFSSPLFTRFHRNVLSLLMGRRSACLRWLCAHGRPVAALYEIIWDNKVLVYQAGRTVDVPKDVRPGIALFLYSIQRAIEADRREYDLLCGDTRYKRQLSGQQRHLLRLDVRRHTPAARTCMALDTVACVAREILNAARTRKSIPG